MDGRKLTQNEQCQDWIYSLKNSRQPQEEHLDNIEIGNAIIHQTSKIKFLRVHLDEKLSLKDHIQNGLKKANYNLRLIPNIQKYINMDTTKMLLSTLVLSQLDYVNSILSRAPTATIKPYQTIQNFAARVAYKKSKKEEAHTCLQELHWLPIKYRTIFKLLTIVYNTLQGNAPQYLKEKLKWKQFPRSTRQSTSSGVTLDIPFNRKNHLPTGVSTMLQQNIGMTSQTTSGMQKTLKYSNPCSRHTSLNLHFLQNNNTNINSKTFFT